MFSLPDFYSETSRITKTSTENQRNNAELEKLAGFQIFQKTTIFLPFFFEPASLQRPGLCKIRLPEDIPPELKMIVGWKKPST